MGYEFSIDDEKKTIMRFLSRKNFYILTRRLVELKQKMEMWITVDIPGAIIYGNGRVGKTTAIRYLSDALGQSYGEHFPVIQWDITDHTPTEKQFYSSFMKAIDLPDPGSRDTALVLKTRIINSLCLLGNETKHRMIILLIDEASELDHKDFIWLMDLYNSLAHHDILLLTFMFGTFALKAMKESLKQRGEAQIIGRFMSKEYVFRGICDKEELEQCLLALDQPMKIDSLDNREIILPKYFFPGAYEEGKYFGFDLTPIFWAAYNRVKTANGIPLDSDIPMQYFLTPFKHCLTIFGKGGPKEKYFPEQKDLEECISESGYVEMCSVYETSKPGTNIMKRKKAV